MAGEFRGRFDQDAPSSSMRPHPSKRPRTTLACQRCKSRKQKCDGREPSCSQCARVASTCQYVVSTVPKPSELRVYVDTLESKVAQLESRLRQTEGSLNDRHPHETFAVGGVASESSLSTTIRDLSLNAGGSTYLGASSNIALARLLEPVLYVDQGPRESQADGRNDEDDHTPLVGRPSPIIHGGDGLDVAAFSESIVDELFKTYMEYVSLPFPIIHSRKLRDMHARRAKPNGLFEVCILHLVYAIGGAHLTLCGHKGNFHSDEHYEAAMAHRAKIIRCIDRRSIIYLTLATLFCMRTPRNPGPGTMIGLAIKLCVSLGLHRKSGTASLDLGHELDKRLFWTCYALDRDINMSMGRPPSICDHDIDCPLPMEVDEDSINPQHFEAALRLDPSTPPEPPTTLSHFLHVLRLKRIASQIQHTIYRVDQPVADPVSATEGFLAKLDEWRQKMPVERTRDGRLGEPHYELDTPSCLHWRDSYLVHYYTCTRFLLFPYLADTGQVDPHFRKIGIAACLGICKSYKQLHQRSLSTAFSPLFIMYLFLAGLTLVYCMWKTPDETNNPAAINALTDCTIMLYVMAERWPQARKFRDTFERLKQIALARCATASQGESQIPSPEASSRFSTTRPADTASGAASSSPTAGHASPPSVAPDHDSWMTSNNNVGTGTYGSDVAFDSILDIVREPFLMWENSDFDFDFSATTAPGRPPGEATSTFVDNPNMYTSDQAIPPDFSFCPDSFGNTDSYDFDPIMYDFPTPADGFNEYRGGLEGLRR